MSEKAKYSFKCLEKECETQACHTREQIRITLGDLSRWTASGQLQHVIDRFVIFPDKEDQNHIAIAAFQKPLKENPEKRACIFYDEETKSCGIMYSKPISCRTYPLEYDGSRFYVSDKNCPGVGKGEISKESLKTARDLAEQEYNERIFTRHVLPGFYSVIMNTVAIQNQMAMSNLSEEDRAKLEELMSKAVPEQPAPEEPQTDPERTDTSDEIQHTTSDIDDE
ncbi:MAG: YkgJ family cysteine cluster protein [Candidatus Thorarchaeota archaeon]